MSEANEPRRRPFSRAPKDPNAEKSPKGLRRGRQKEATEMPALELGTDTPEAAPKKRGLNFDISFKPKSKGPSRKNSPFGLAPSVDLTPKKRREQLETDAAKLLWRRVVLATAIVAVTASLASYGLKTLAQTTYDGALSSQTGLDQEIAAYDSVASALQVQNEVKANIVSAVGSEIFWDQVVAKIQSNLPADARVGSLTIRTGGTTAGSPAVAVTLQVESSSPNAYSQLYEAFLQEEGLSGLNIGNIASSGGANGGTVYNYPLSFGIDISVLTNRFLEEDSLTSPAPGGSSLPIDGIAPLTPEDLAVMDPNDLIPTPEDPILQAPLDPATAETGDGGL